MKVHSTADGFLHGLVDAQTLRNVAIESNFGISHFVSHGRIPEDVFQAACQYMQRIAVSDVLSRHTHIARMELKLCRNKVSFIELEQRPAGLGITGQAADRYGLENPVDRISTIIAADLRESICLFSPKRQIKDGISCHTDDHLFCFRCLPWDQWTDRQKRPIIIRSQREEDMPPKLLRAVRRKSAPLIMSPYEVPKYASYIAVKTPCKYLNPLVANDETSSRAKQVRAYLYQVFDDLGTDRIVIKPQDGTRARNVRRLHRSEVEGITGRSGIVSNFRNKKPIRYIIQPYYEGLYEEKLYHLYRIFFAKTPAKNVWRGVAGFLNTSDHWLVHGTEDAQFHYLDLPS